MHIRGLAKQLIRQRNRSLRHRNPNYSSEKPKSIRHRNRNIYMDEDGWKWIIFIHHHPFSSIFIHDHPPSSVTIHFHPPPSIFIHHHPFLFITVINHHSSIFIHFYPHTSITVHFHPSFNVIHCCSYSPTENNIHNVKNIHINILVPVTDRFEFLWRLVWVPVTDRSVPLTD